MVSFQEILTRFIEYFLNVVIPRATEMVVATIQKKETLEILIPLTVTLFLVQVYFGRNKDEQIGWNTAYANCIVLLFVTANLGAYVYENYGLTAFYENGTQAYYKTLFVIILGLTAVCLMFIDFFHSIDERMSFLLSSSIFISLIAFVATVLVYSEIPFDKVTLITSLFILLALIIFFGIVKWMIPPSEKAEEFLEKKKEKRERKVREVVHDVKIKRNRIVRSLELISGWLRYKKERMKKFFHGKKFE